MRPFWGLLGAFSASFRPPTRARSGKTLARFYRVFMRCFWGVFGAFLTPAKFGAILCENDYFQGHDWGLFGKFSGSFRGVFDHLLDGSGRMCQTPSVVHHSVAYTGRPSAAHARRLRLTRQSPVNENSRQSPSFFIGPFRAPYDFFKRRLNEPKPNLRSPRLDNAGP